jgi:endonuclease YncB( thermonuclease family)
VFGGLVRRIVRWVGAGSPEPPRPHLRRVPRLLSARPSDDDEVVLIEPPPPRARRCCPSPNPTLRIEGHAWVVDGDTIEIEGIPIRLFGIDAPEMDHPWGWMARVEMILLCDGRMVRCIPDGSTSHDRLVARCFLPDGRDLSAELVRRGLALDWPKFSGGAYRSLEPPGARIRLWRVDARQRGAMPPRRA